jgi:hypothetical protein
VIVTYSCHVHGAGPLVISSADWFARLHGGLALTALLRFPALAPPSQFVWGILRKDNLQAYRRESERA